MYLDNLGEAMRLVLNLLITVGLLLLFNHLGWLELKSHGAPVEFSNMTWSTFGSVLLVAIIIWLVSIVVRFIVIVAAVITIGLALLLASFIGWAILESTAYFMPESLVLHGFWITALCGLLMMALTLSDS